MWLNKLSGRSEGDPSSLIAPQDDKLRLDIVRNLSIKL